MTPTILIIDDDRDFCETMESLILRMGYNAVSAHTLDNGLSVLKSQKPDIVFLDVRLPDGNGLDALPEIRECPSNPEVIILTGQGDPDGAELAIQGGVWDYLLKPTSIKQTRLSLSRALKYRQEKITETPVLLKLDNIVGSSPPMRECYELLAKAAKSNSQVLITGETGTGKELFARCIHENSNRSDGTFVAVDCASLTESLLESTLFGHKKGAFTGADRDRIGLVGLANGGTLFLDEIGDIPLSLQKSFLRVLQEKTFRPVGHTREQRSDFRLIAATNRDLEAMVSQNEFRQDLLYRLLTIHLKLPPLRKRLSDIKPLCLYFIHKLCLDYDLPDKGIDPDVFDMLAAHDWPGNVRELYNVMETAFIASGEKKTLFVIDLPADFRIRVTRASIEQHAPVKHTDENRYDTPNQKIIDATRTLLRQEHPNSLPTLKVFKNLAEAAYLKVIIEETKGDPQTIQKISGLSKSHFYTLLKKNTPE